MLTNKMLDFINSIFCNNIYNQRCISVLDSAVNFTDQVLPVRLPSIPIEDPDVYSGSRVSIMGWGNGTTNTLQTADLEVYKQRCFKLKGFSNHSHN